MSTLRGYSGCGSIFAPLACRAAKRLSIKAGRKTLQALTAPPYALEALCAEVLQIEETTGSSPPEWTWAPQGIPARWVRLSTSSERSELLRWLHGSG
jgi:hypothetical protein